MIIIHDTYARSKQNLQLHDCCGAQLMLTRTTHLHALASRSISRPRAPNGFSGVSAPITVRCWTAARNFFLECSGWQLAEKHKGCTVETSFTDETRREESCCMGIQAAALVLKALEIL
jgi:hypothetical protein